MLLAGSTSIKAQDMRKEKPILKNDIKLNSDLMTPEALWAMGRIGGYAASPDGKLIVYNVAYYSVKEKPRALYHERRRKQQKTANPLYKERN